jgi:hypothetical protein
VAACGSDRGSHEARFCVPLPALTGSITLMTAAFHSTTLRIHRRESDSSTLTHPRVFARTFCGSGRARPDCRLGYRIRHPEGLLVEYLQHRPSEYDVDVPSGIVSSLDFRMCIAADRDVGFIGSMTDGGQAGAKAAEEGNRPTATSCPDW